MTNSTKVKVYIEKKDDVDPKPPKRNGICGPCIWFKEKPLSRWQFIVLLLFGFLTALCVVIRLTGSLTGDIIAGVSGLILAVYGAIHFRKIQLFNVIFNHKNLLIMLFCILFFCLINLKYMITSEMNIFSSFPITVAPMQQSNSNLILHQQTINTYLRILSNQSYDSCTENITISGLNGQKYVFKCFSLDMLSTIQNKTSLLFVGDSIARSSFEFLATQLHNYHLFSFKNYSKSHTITKQLNILKKNISLPMVDVKEYRSVFNHKRNTRQNIYNIQLRLDFNDSLIKWNKSINIWSYKSIHYLAESTPDVSRLNATNNIWNKTNVVFANFGGLHQLIFWPHKILDKNHRGVLWLELYMNDLINAAVQNQNIKCFIVRDVNPICDSEWDSGFKTAVDAYKSMVNKSNQELLKITQFTNCLKHYNISTTTDLDKIYFKYSYNTTKRLNNSVIVRGADICSSKYSFSNYGTFSMNQRMRHFVQNKQIELSKKLDTSMKLLYFDGNQLFQNRCQFTDARKDGKHFHLAEPVHSMALFNIIDLFCS